MYLILDKKYIIILFLIAFSPIVYALNDGPYVFYRNDTIEIITVLDGDAIKETYDKGSDIFITVPESDNIPSFDIKLRNEYSIDNHYIRDLPDSFLVIADFHGRFEGFVTLLQYLNIIDESLNWSFDDGVVIQLGDMLSRGDMQTEILWLTYKLEKEAEKSGGGFYTILGNHEIMHLTGDLRYVHEKYFESAGIMGLEYDNLFSEDSLFGSWIRTKNVIMQMGDYLFLHGGYSPELMESEMSIDEINHIIRDGLSGISHPKTQLLNGSYGPLWYRGYFISGTNPHAPYEKLNQEDIDTIIDYLNVDRIFVGHTRFDELQFKYHGRVIGVDIEHAPDKIEGFFYKDKTGYRVGSNGLKEKLFTEKEEQYEILDDNIHESQEQNI